MEIRQIVQQEDFDAAVTLVAAFTEESLNEYGTYLDLDQLKKTFDKIYETSFVAVVDGKVVGILGGHLVTDFCSPLPVYEEVIWYMKKEYRRNGMELFHHALQWCKEHDIKRFTMCCMHNLKTEILFKIYKKMGFEPMETRFLLKLD